LLAALALGLGLVPGRLEAAADRIDWPTDGSSVSGRVAVRGTALSDGPNFRSYRLEFGAGRAPTSWQPIGPERDHTVEHDVLGLWETDGLAPGEYTLRLTVFDEGGQAAESRIVVAVGPTSAPVGATAGTATPAPTATPSPAAAPASATPTASPPPSPTPTATPAPSPSPEAIPQGPGNPVRCPVLYYHEVPNQAKLAAQLATFLQAGYRPVKLGRLVDAVEGRSDAPPGCLVLTFDDGLASQMSGALPALLQFSVPATFFVLPGFQDGVHRYMTSDDYRALRDAGMEVASHTLNHATLPTLLRANFGAFQSELVNSKTILEQTLGQAVELLAYPNGAWDELTADEVRRAGYRAAASTLPGAWQRPEELYWLRRLRADPWEPAANVLARLSR